MNNCAHVPAIDCCVLRNCEYFVWRAAVELQSKNEKKKRIFPAMELVMYGGLVSKIVFIVYFVSLIN